MHRSVPRTAFLASVVAVTCLGPLATEASALTINPAGPVTFTSIGSVSLKSITTGASVTCAMSTLSGNVARLSGDVSRTLSFNGATFTTPTNPYRACDGLEGLHVEIRPQGLPWTFTSLYHVPAGGRTDGKIAGVMFQIIASDGCVASIGGPTGGAGNVDATYTNATAQLKLYYRTSFGYTNLRVNSTNAFCDPLLINLWDQVFLEGIYTANPAIVITSP